MFVPSTEMESKTQPEFCVYKSSLRCLLDSQVEMTKQQLALGLPLRESRLEVRLGVICVRGAFRHGSMISSRESPGKKKCRPRTVTGVSREVTKRRKKIKA